MQGCERPERPPTCDERCGQIADRLYEACVAEGGTEADCALKRDALLAECVDRCNDPAPSCEERCERAAERVFAACIEAGGDEAECRARAEEFAGKCRDRMARICDREDANASAAPRPFRRGDVNKDGVRDITDPIGILGALFQGLPGIGGCPDAADSNDDGSVDISDAVHKLISLFLGTVPVPGPVDEEKQDPTADLLICDS